jgi:hypothetical protein
MAMTRRTRNVLVAAAVVLGAAVLLGPRLAVHMLDARVREALGDKIVVDEIVLGWATLELLGVRLPSPSDWPVPDALRIASVRITPRLSTVFSRQVVVDAIEVDGLYLAARRRPGEPLEVLPGIDLPRPHRRSGAASASDDDPRHQVHIGRMTVTGGAFDLFDATVATPPYRTHLSGLSATVTNVERPARGRRSRVSLRATLDGPKRAGELSVQGFVALGSGTAQLRTTLVGADLAAFRPWLRRAGTPIRGGVVDVSLDSTIRDGTIDAPGRLTIRRITFDGAESAMLERLLTLPRDAAFRAVTGAGARLRVRFVLEGPVDAPRLVVTDAPGREVATALGEVVGAAPAGVVEGAGALGQAGATGIEATARGAARAIGRLFRRE